MQGRRFKFAKSPKSLFSPELPICPLTNRTKAYDADLRWRIVYQRKAMEFTLQKVAQNLGVSVATAYRTEELSDETGDVCKRMYPPGHGNKKLTDVDALFIVERLVERPATYLKRFKCSLSKGMELMLI